MEDSRLPGPEADEFEWLRFEQDDVVSWAPVRGHVGRAAAANRLRGRQRPKRGGVVAHSGPLTRSQQLWAAVLRAERHAVLAGATAATLEGLRG